MRNFSVGAASTLSERCAMICGIQAEHSKATTVRRATSPLTGSSGERQG